VSKVVKDLSNVFKITKTAVSSYLPRRNGAVGRTGIVISSIIKSYIGDSQINWLFIEYYLEFAVFRMLFPELPSPYWWGDEREAPVTPYSSFTVICSNRKYDHEQLQNNPRIRPSTSIKSVGLLLESSFGMHIKGKLRNDTFRQTSVSYQLAIKQQISSKKNEFNKSY